MRWADLVLSYLQVLVWPIVVLCAIVLFRGQIRSLLASLTKFSVFGAEANFAVRLKEQIEETSVEIDQASSNITRKSIHRAGQRPVDEEVVRSLAFVDFSDFDSTDPASTCVEVVRRLDEAVSRVFEYFDIPVRVIDLDSAAYMLEYKTDVDTWEAFFDIYAQFKKLVSGTLKAKDHLQGRWRLWQVPTDDEFKGLTGLAYRIADLLSSNVRRSLANQVREKSAGSRDEGQKISQEVLDDAKEEVDSDMGKAIESK